MVLHETQNHNDKADDMVSVLGVTMPESLARAYLFERETKEGRKYIVEYIREESPNRGWIQPMYVRKFDPKCGIFLSNIFTWDSHGSDPNGWVYQSKRQLREYTGLGECAQRKAREILVEARYLEEEKRVGWPPRMFYRVNLGRILADVDPEKARALRILEYAHQRDARGDGGLLRLLASHTKPTTASLVRGNPEERATVTPFTETAPERGGHPRYTARSQQDNEVYRQQRAVINGEVSQANHIGEISQAVDGEVSQADKQIDTERRVSDNPSSEDAGSGFSDPNPASGVLDANASTASRNPDKRREEQEYVESNLESSVDVTVSVESQEKVDSSSPRAGHTNIARVREGQVFPLPIVDDFSGENAGVVDSEPEQEQRQAIRRLVDRDYGGDWKAMWRDYPKFDPYSYTRADADELLAALKARSELPVTRTDDLGRPLLVVGGLPVEAPRDVGYKEWEDCKGYIGSLSPEAKKQADTYWSSDSALREVV